MMANGQDVGNDEPLTTAQRDALINRMNAAWSNLPRDKRVALKPLIEEADEQLANFLYRGIPPSHRAHQILRMKSYLTDDWNGHVERLDYLSAAEAIEVTVGPGGQILGTGKYEEFDPRWTLVGGTIWLENLLHKHPFPRGTPAPVSIDDHVSIVLAGDFGTGNFGANDSPSTKISKIITGLKPHVSIHLGDVYYAGTSGEENSKLINYWPKGLVGSFTLNSNHEMYSGGGPYFNDAVGGPVFNKFQSPFSFFALENSKWIIVGLDSAYNADVLSLYMDGSLGDNVQFSFLQELAQRGEKEEKKLIILTHHNGLPENGGQPSEPLKLFTEVMRAFRGVSPPAYWYWGHLHAGIAYRPLKDLKGMLCRCVGHAAIPWGLASDLQASPEVEWFEKRNAKDPEIPLRVYNGFVLLQLDGTNLTETYYDETGHVAWMPKGADQRFLKGEIGQYGGR
ncbi:MAG: metallophosphoesterase [Candidatus Acidiferrales bacterium]|jgi:hypothetical protein